MYSFKSGRIKPKKEKTFGVKKPFKISCRNRKGSTNITVNRIKPVYSVANKNNVSSLDRKYLEYLQCLDVVCFCCGEHNGIEWHHVKLYSDDKKDHTRLIPLCGVKCHRLGTVLSAHGTPKKWRETFSMKEQLNAAKKFHDEFLSLL